MQSSPVCIKPQSVPNPPPSLDGSGHKASCPPANIALLLFLRVHHQTLSVAYAHLMAHTKALAVCFQTAPNLIRSYQHHLIRSYQANNHVMLYSGQILHLYTSMLPKMLSRNTSPLCSHDHLTKLWIVTDGSVAKSGIGATLYVNRNSKLQLAGFFQRQIAKHQVTWLPCEIEPLSIAASIKHFSPYIIQSVQPTCLLKDSKPCVQAVQKLCCGEFSASPRVTSFLSIVSSYAVHVQHLARSSNIPSHFSRCNAAECSEPLCQVCTFIAATEDSVQDIRNLSHLSFTTRSAWYEVQAECPDLRRTHAHLKQGT